MNQVKSNPITKVGRPLKISNFTGEIMGASIMTQYNVCIFIITQNNFREYKIFVIKNQFF